MPISKKTSRLFALCAVFSVLVGVSVAPAGVCASAPFQDDFNSYNAGDLNNQGSWANNGLNISGVVQSDVVVSGKAVEFIADTQNAAGNTKVANRLTSGSMYFQFKILHSGGSGSDSLASLTIDYDGQQGDVLNAAIKNVNGIPHLQQSNPSINVALEFDVWYSLGVVWQNGNTNYAEFEIFLDNVSIGSKTGINWLAGGGVGGVKFVVAKLSSGGITKLYLDNITADYTPLVPPHELAITYPEDETSLDDQLNHFSVEYFTPDCGDFHLQIAIGTDKQAVENATSSSSGIEYIDTLFALPEWCAANGKIDVGNYVILDEDTTYYAKPMLYRWEGWAQRYNTKLAEGSVISFAIGEYFGLATANAASSFYTSHLPAFFGEAQPSAIYSTLVKVFNAVFNPLLKFLSDITIYFSTATAIENGANAGYPIAVFLAYAALINDFAGIPLVEIITTMLILQLAIVVINLALKGKKTVA